MEESFFGSDKTSINENELVQNFERILVTTSPTSSGNSWHISLSLCLSTSNDSNLAGDFYLHEHTTFLETESTFL